MRSSVVISLERDDVWMIEFPQMTNVRLLNVAHFLDSDLVLVELSEEDRSLSATPEPLQIGNVLKWNFPVI